MNADQRNNQGGVMLFDSVPGHHQINNLQTCKSAFSFHFIPNLWRGTIRLVWNAGVVLERLASRLAAVWDGFRDTSGSSVRLAFAT
jgi:hypothetical protein